MAVWWGDQTITAGIGKAVQTLADFWRTTGALPRITADPMSVRMTALEVQLPRINVGL